MGHVLSLPTLLSHISSALNRSDRHERAITPIPEDNEHGLVALSLSRAQVPSSSRMEDLDSLSLSRRAHGISEPLNALRSTCLEQAPYDH